MSTKKKQKVKKVPEIVSSSSESRQFVLVGTYKKNPNQWSWIQKRRLYNYPLSEEEAKAGAEGWDKVKELWLYSGFKDRRHIYAAQFVGIKSRKEFFVEYPDYPKSKNPHGDFYAVFSVKYKYQPTIDDSTVVVRARDFAKRTPKIAQAIKEYQAGGELGCLLDYLPAELAPLPHSQLRVCEAALQLDFFAQMEQSEFNVSVAPFIMTVPEKRSLKAELMVDLPHFKKEFTHVDCFSGVGGFCTGLHAAGFTTKVAIEKVKSCVETYVANHPNVHVINKDIRNVTAAEILPYCPSDGVDLVTSGMPCETFSTAGNTSRSFYDDRQFLFREGIRVAKIVNAKYLLFENVPGITSKTVSKGDSTLIVDVLKDEMLKAGYGNFIEVILDATRFGVPQKRKRFFILGTRIASARLRRPISHVTRTFTVGDALEGLPPVIPNSWQEGKSYRPSHGEYVAIMRDDTFWRRGSNKTNSISYHMPMKHRPATLERFARLEQGESLRDLFTKYKGDELKALQSRHVLPKKIFIKRNYKLPINEPSPTVTSHCLDEFVHPLEDRALTVRECARLQSFPDSYDFAGGPYIVPHINRDVQDKYEQIGDAVPPLLAYAWGKTILEMLIEDKQ